jgi:hypothetical protein
VLRSTRRILHCWMEMYEIRFYCTIVCALTRAFQYINGPSFDLCGFGDENSLRYGLGPHQCDYHVSSSALNRGTPTKTTAETPVENRLKRLWLRIGEAMKRLRWARVGRWWLAWVSGARLWVLGSSKAANVACSVVLDVDTVHAL